MRICFDLDDTLCTGKPYRAARPIPGAKQLLKQLKDKGHTIVISTARGMGRYQGDADRAIRDLGKLTLDQLDRWDFIYDEIYFGKPAADLYVDDKALLVVDYDQVMGKVRCLEQAWSEVSEKIGRLEAAL